METSDSQIAIIGAGIGGLALAHALDSYGFEVTLLEQAEQLSEIGAGLSLWENGLEALAAIGLREKVEALGRPWDEYEIHRAGKSVVRRNNKLVSKDGSVSPLIIKRGALFDTLLDTLSPNVEVRRAFKVKDIQGQTLISKKGQQLRAQLSIGADGSHSRLRDTLTEKTLRFCNQICFRGISQFQGVVPLTGTEVYDSAHHRFGYFPLSETEIYWFDIVDSKQPLADFETYRPQIENLSPLIANILAHTDLNSILCHPIEEMRPVTKFSEHSVLIGDAAHPLQPSLGQGACLALEDAIVLAQSLKTHADDFPKAIKLYLSKRKRRWTLYYTLCRQLSAGALDKGIWGRRLALARIVHTPDWAMSTFGRRMFAFKP